MATTIFSATGGNGGGVSINNFTDTQVQWNVPVTEFDIYMQGLDNPFSFTYTYVGTTTQPDALYEITLAEMQAVGGWSTELEGTINIQFRAGGTLATTTVSIRDTTPLNAANLNAYIEQWWEREVKPELEAINTTLELILAQHTTVATNSTTVATNTSSIAAEIATIDTAIQRLRDLADHPSGPGIRTVQPYGYLGNAILYLLYIKQAQILEDGEAGENVQAEALAKFNDLLDEMFARFDPNRGGFND
jgi:hypothetical protein